MKSAGRAARVRALVVAGRQTGDPPDIGAPHLVIAADGGLDTVRRWGLRADAVVGDLDSASEDALRWARRGGAMIEEHPVDKDRTDLELALAHAAGRVDSIHAVLPDGGRLDHAAINLAVLASPQWAGVDVTATIGEAHVTVVRGSRRLGGDVGDVVSLLAVGGPVLVASTSGLLYGLTEEVLSPTEGRGTSNVIVTSPAAIEVAEGVLLAIRPGDGC